MQKAASLAADAEEKEQRGQFAQAKAEHSEAARLFRLSAASVQDESHQQQLRALARHHDARAKWCETAEAAKVRIQKKKKKKKNSKLYLFRSWIKLVVRAESRNLELLKCLSTIPSRLLPLQASNRFQIRRIQIIRMLSSNRHRGTFGNLWNT